MGLRFVFLNIGVLDSDANMVLEDSDVEMMVVAEIEVSVSKNLWPVVCWGSGGQCFWLLCCCSRR